MRSAALVVVAGMILGACTDEEIVYRDRPPFNPPPDAQSGFLGYFTVSTKQTTCGNCHVGHQRDWVATAHADAWADLQASGGVQPGCSSCHSLTERGNAVEGTAGYDAVADSAYHDVQCESCHGPGFDHVQEPDVGPVPLARLAAEVSDTVGTCGECHSAESGDPFVEEWEQSRHAEANDDVITNYLSNPTTYASCLSCHEGRSVIKAWGSTADYVEKDDPINHSTALGVTCAVCHDPHGSPNTKQLRFPIDTDDPAQNLCMKCHMRRTVPASGSSRGNVPHAPQGAVLLGDAGWANPAYVDTVLLSASSTASHGSLTANPRLCAGCHLYSFTVTQAPVRNATGHLFRPIPCYGPGGVPTDTILNCAFTAAVRSFKPCAAAGCHATENQAALVYSVSRGRLQDLAAALWSDLDGDRTIDAFPTDTGYLAKIKQNSTDLNPTAAPVSAADGAEFNVRTFGEDASGVFLYLNGDKSRGAHNPFYAEALLRGSIDELAAVYSDSLWFPVLSPAMRQMLSGPMGVSGSVPFPRPRAGQ